MHLFIFSKIPNIKILPYRTPDIETRTTDDHFLYFAQVFLGQRLKMSAFLLAVSLLFTVSLHTALFTTF